MEIIKNLNLSVKYCSIQGKLKDLMQKETRKMMEAGKSSSNTKESSRNIGSILPFSGPTFARQ